MGGGGRALNSTRSNTKKTAIPTSKAGTLTLDAWSFFRSTLARESGKSSSDRSYRKKQVFMGAGPGKHSGQSPHAPTYLILCFIESS
ncbi:hypothetical protein I79_017760 [Cricetulus griseus]|uniref:Uncharacterized protein n=1 Tax=Cricetulus griseus TaxID=10029 RepID=G3I2W5_CRIGR|nr:hypothetical protein I79_017760 [Cricetulus griseus]